MQPTLCEAPYWAPAPENWRPGRHILSDADPPSQGLRLVLEYEGSVSEPWPHSRSYGCVTEVVQPAMIFDNGRNHSWVCPEVAPQTRHVNLMRTCHAVYDDMLDILYAGTTVCLFDAEMVHHFMRNSSPEGRSRVRHVQLALTVPSESWKSRPQKRRVEQALDTIHHRFPGLRQFYVEVVLTEGQPSDPRDFWKWIMCILGVFRELDAFVAKFSIYHRRTYGPPKFVNAAAETLSSWDEDEYAHLKTAVAGGRPCSDPNSI